ncbi:uncharacterized protein [Typha latifolia]|uniref:uncharacterized protein n=1 Tax=Typha latifolia TaxID=4733 RepID=UPI003C2EBE3B
MALNAKNKLGFVDGSISKSTDDVAVVQLWERCNDMVLSWLLNAIDKSLTNSLIYCNTPREVWLDLEGRFSHSNNPRVFKSKRDISNLHQDSMTVAIYYNTIKAYWDELTILCSLPSYTCGALKELSTMQDIEHIFQFLMGLNDSYSSICSQILAMDPLPTVSKVKAVIVQSVIIVAEMVIGKTTTTRFMVIQRIKINVQVRDK